MPNYCDNELKITGLQKDVVKFLNDFSKKSEESDTLDFDMNNIVPQPSTPDDPEFNWYNWRLDNWGCKWNINIYNTVEDAYDQIIDAEADDEVETVIPYETPWGPNLEFLQIASRKYPDLEFNSKFYEPGCEVAGDFTYINGDEFINFEYKGNDLLSYLVWVIDNSFEDYDYIMDEMNLDNDIRQRLENHYNVEINDESDEDILDLRNAFLGNNLPDPE